VREAAQIFETNSFRGFTGDQGMDSGDCMDTLAMLGMKKEIVEKKKELKYTMGVKCHLQLKRSEVESRHRVAVVVFKESATVGVVEAENVLETKAPVHMSRHADDGHSETSEDEGDEFSNIVDSSNAFTNQAMDEDSSDSGDEN
jgi:hypothetical protein